MYVYVYMHVFVLLWNILIAVTSIPPGLGVPEAKIWERIHCLGEDYIQNGDDPLSISPTVYGERHLPNQRASVSNITPFNTTLGSVYSALSRGLITNLHSMMSQDFLLAAGVQRIVGSGTAVVKNKKIQQEIEQQYKLPLVLSEESEADAAVGAALAVAGNLWYILLWTFTTETKKQSRQPQFQSGLLHVKRWSNMIKFGCCISNFLSHKHC